MGAECSVDRLDFNNDETSKQTKTDQNHKNFEISKISVIFDYKTYKDYSIRLNLFQTKLQETMKRIEITSDFKIQRG